MKAKELCIEENDPMSPKNKETTGVTEKHAQTEAAEDRVTTRRKPFIRRSRDELKTVQEEGGQPFIKILQS